MSIDKKEGEYIFPSKLTWEEIVRILTSQWNLNHDYQSFINIFNPDIVIKTSSEWDSVNYLCLRVSNDTFGIINWDFVDYSNRINYRELLILDGNELDERIFLIEWIINELEELIWKLVFTEETQTNIIHCIRILKLKDKDKYSDLIKRMQLLLSKIRKKEEWNVKVVEFWEVFRNLDQSQYKAYWKTISIIQLTTWCTIWCPDCNFNAIKNVRSRLSWDTISKICDIFWESLRINEVFLYYATDPLDWEDEEWRNYMDIQKLVYEKIWYYPRLTTAIPKWKEELARELWKTPVQMRVSITYMNKKRLWIENQEDAERYFWKPWNPNSFFFFNEFSIDVKDYNYRDNIPSIWCRDWWLVTPEWVFSMVSTDTTPDTPNWYRKYDIDINTEYFIWHDFTYSNTTTGRYQKEKTFIGKNGNMVRWYIDLNYYHLFSEFFLPLLSISFEQEWEKFNVYYSNYSRSDTFLNSEWNNYHQVVEISDIIKHIERYRLYFEKNELAKRMLAKENKRRIEEIQQNEKITYEQLEKAQKEGWLVYYELSLKYIKQEMLKLLF